LVRRKYRTGLGALWCRSPPRSLGRGRNLRLGIAGGSAFNNALTARWLGLSSASRAAEGGGFFAARSALRHELGMKTFVATPENRQRDWYVVDADGRTLGRLATQIANALRGKRKPEYTPHCDVGDFIVVVNAEKISVTGDKRKTKLYRRHSGYPGGLRTRTLGEMLDRQPEEVIRRAVKGMLPRNRLARQQLTKLKVYAGPEHPHSAQDPKPMEVEA
jgi:large subunit ribosomal protein L13